MRNREERAKQYEYIKYIRKYIQNNAYIIIFDTETTGLKKNDKIIQFSAKRFKIIKDELGIWMVLDKSFSVFINPLQKLDDKIIKLTGIKQSIVDAADIEEDIFPEIINFLKEKPKTVLASYNSSFDEMKLYTTGQRCGIKVICETTEQYDLKNKLEMLDIVKFNSFDILKAVRYFYDYFEKFNLETVVKLLRLNEDEDIRFHNAFDDVEAASKVFEEILGKLFQKMTYPNKILNIKSCREFNPSHRVNRLYVTGKQGQSVYYDRYLKEWKMAEKYSPFIYDCDDLEKKIKEKGFEI